MYINDECLTSLLKIAALESAGAINRGKSLDDAVEIAVRSAWNTYGQVALLAEVRAQEDRRRRAEIVTA